MSVQKVTLFCFGASYAVALALEVLHLLRPRLVHRLLGAGFGLAGLFAHTAYLLVQRPPLASQAGSVLFLAWILAVFYVYGSMHYRKLAWGVFVLPLVLGLTVLAWLLGQGAPDFDEARRSWLAVHAGLLLLAAVGVSVGFLASIMYLVQARRLRAKALPGQGVRLLSLERLEQMNRRAVNLAFPLLTAGILVGFVLQADPDRQLPWTDPKGIAGLVLWLVFGLLLYLRYGYHARGRHLALLTIVAFPLLLFALTLQHLGQGGGP